MKQPACFVNHSNFLSNKSSMYNSRKSTKRENFKPRVDWIEDRYSRVLIIQLPGFKRGEIKVELNNAGKLSIKGSRLAAGNKYIDVDQSFDVPEDVIGVINAQIEDEILVFIMSKNVIAEAAAKEQTESKEAVKNKESKREEEKREQGKIDSRNKDENTREDKTASNDAMQNKTNQKEKSTIAEAMASSIKSAKFHKTDAVRNEPTKENEKLSAGADSAQNEFHSKAKTQKRPKDSVDNSNKDQDVKNGKVNTDEGILHQEKKEAEQTIEEMKENNGDRVKAVSSQVKSGKEIKRERMQKMKLKMNEIYRDTPGMIRKKISKMRRSGEDGWSNNRYIDGAVEKVNRNRNTIAVVVTSFSVGLYVAYKLKARSG